MRSKEAESLTKLNRVQGLLSWAILVGLGLTLVAAYLYVLDCGRKGTLTYENLLPEEATEGYMLKRFDGLIARSHSDVKVDFYHPALHIWQFSYATPTTDLSTLQNLGQWAMRRSWKLVEIDSRTAFLKGLQKATLNWLPGFGYWLIQSAMRWVSRLPKPLKPLASVCRAQIRSLARSRNRGEASPSIRVRRV